MKTAATFRVEEVDLGMRSWMISHEEEGRFEKFQIFLTQKFDETIDFAVLGRYDIMF